MPLTLSCSNAISAAVSATYSPSLRTTSSHLKTEQQPSTYRARPKRASECRKGLSGNYRHWDPGTLPWQEQRQPLPFHQHRETQRPHLRGDERSWNRPSSHNRQPCHQAVRAAPDLRSGQLAQARRSFIGNLYKKVKDPKLVGKLSGHCEGSKAFARYRDIDDDMIKEMTSLLD